MVHEVRLLGLNVAAATIAIRGTVVPDVPVMVAIMVVIRSEWSELRVDVCGNVGGMSLWLVASRVLIEHSPIIVSRSSASGTHVFGRVET